MSEFTFVLKCFLSTAILIFGLQIKIDNLTIESYVYKFLTRTAAADSVQKVASGGALAIRNVYSSAANFLALNIKSEDIQKAAKFNFEFKRSPTAEVKNKTKN